MCWPTFWPIRHPILYSSEKTQNLSTDDLHGRRFMRRIRSRSGADELISEARSSLERNGKTGICRPNLDISD